MSIRQSQIESTLKRAVMAVLARGIADPRVEGLVSVTKLEVSPDLRDAYVSISVIPEKHQKKALAGLRHAAPFIHAQVCKAVALKTVPHLDFRLDTSLKKQAAVFDAIRRGMEQEARGAETRGEAAGPDAAETSLDPLRIDGGRREDPTP